VETEKQTNRRDTSPRNSPPTRRDDAPQLQTGDAENYNYRKFVWAIVLGVFLLFFLADTFEHTVLPQFRIGRVSWFFTTGIATLLAWHVGRAFLSNLEKVHNRLVSQNRSLAEQSQTLAQQSERLALSVQEAHHRIKNNLQTVAALLSWYDGQGEIPQNALRESVARIRSIALVHDLLTKDTPLSVVDAAQVIEKIQSNLSNTVQGNNTVRIECDLQPLEMPSRQATSLALIVNELILNAFEHAFPERRTGQISIVLREREGEAYLAVADDGIGLPPDFDLYSSQHTGLQIARSLVEEDLAGTLRFTSSGMALSDSNAPDVNLTGGTVAEINFRNHYDER
jgi:two-component sensor histidine kinase